MWKAFEEMERIGWVGSQRRPRMVSVQAENCAPIVRAFEEGTEKPQPWEGATTIADGLRVPRAIGDFLILRAVRESGGTAVAVSDRSMVDGMLAIGEARRRQRRARRRRRARRHSAARGERLDEARRHDRALQHRRSAEIPRRVVSRITTSATEAPDTHSVAERHTQRPRGDQQVVVGRHVFVFPTISSSRRATISGGSKATIVSKSPCLMSSTALPPNRVASTRSKLVGAPPRCR